MKQLVLLAVVIVLGVVVVMNTKSKVSYVNIDCPRCGSTEVLDFGENINGEKKCHCADCQSEFYIDNNNF